MKASHRSHPRTIHITFSTTVSGGVLELSSSDVRRTWEGWQIEVERNDLVIIHIARPTDDGPSRQLAASSSFEGDDPVPWESVDSGVRSPAFTAAGSMTLELEALADDPAVAPARTTPIIIINKGGKPEPTEP